MLPIITEAFEKAKRIEFWAPEDIEKEPGAIILVYDEEPAMKTNARASYNYLLAVLNSSTSKLKIVQKDKSITVSFIDKEKHIDIAVSNLPFIEGQLKAFLENYPPDISFGFMLGVDASLGRPALLSTKEQFEILTLAGYEK